MLKCLWSCGPEKTYDARCRTQWASAGNSRDGNVSRNADCKDWELLEGNKDYQESHKAFVCFLLFCFCLYSKNSNKVQEIP